MWKFEMEELVGLEPTHVGFAIRGITSFAIAPKKIMIFLCIYFYKKEWQRTRDSNPRRLSPRRFSKPVQSTNSVNPLQLNGANGENRTHTPKPERDFKSRASTYSATLAQNLRTFLSFHLNWTGIIVAFFLFVKSFLKKFKNFNFYTI